jgi:hypothetical protein
MSENGPKVPALDIDSLRHDVSTSISHFESAYEELQQDPSNEFARQLFEAGIARLRDLIHKIDGSPTEKPQ